MYFVRLFLQRDLDFTIDVDFNGELSTKVDTRHYKMRQFIIVDVVEMRVQLFEFLSTAVSVVEKLVAFISKIRISLVQANLRFFLLIIAL